MNLFATALSTRSSLAAGLLLAAAAMFNPAARAADAPAPIRLGLIEAMSGPFADAGEAVARNLRFAIERVNARGGVRLADGAHPLQLDIHDSKGQTAEALAELERVADQGSTFALQGNGSAVAAALIDAIERRNRRDPGHRLLFLNYSAVDPALTNEHCSPWHFRFDAHADMRMAALVDVLADDRRVTKVYLINQDYSFGRHLAVSARAALARRRPDVQIVGDDLHPLGRVSDFGPYAAKIKASGADAVITGNWGDDLTLLVRAARDAGLDAGFYTFYGDGLGAPTAIGDAGVGRIHAVAEWHPNDGGAAMLAVYEDFLRRVARPRDDYFKARFGVMIEMLVLALERAGRVDADAVAGRLAGMRYGAADGNPLGDVWMRAADHQLIGPLVVSVMEPVGTPGVAHDIEASGFGFRTERRLPPSRVEMPTSCRMPAID